MATKQKILLLIKYGFSTLISTLTSMFGIRKSKKEAATNNAENNLFDKKLSLDKTNWQPVVN